MLSNYIKSLIDIHSRVIVPDLGAFMLKGDPSKTIYFNEFLRFNDGLLVDHIAEIEKIDKIEAAKKVKSFVDEINKDLAGNKSVNIEGIGILYLDVNEKIQLKTPEGIETNVVKPTEPIVESKSREIDFELEQTKPSPEPPKIQDTTASQIPTSATIPVPSAGPPVKEAKSAASTTVTPRAAPAPDTKERKIAPPPPRKEEVAVNVVHTKTRRRMILVGIIGVLVIGTIVYFAFFRTHGKNANINRNITIGANDKSDSSALSKDSVNTSKPEEPVSQNKTSTSQTAEVKQKGPVKAEPKNVANTENKVKPAPVKKTTHVESVDGSGGRKFYIIAGTFSVESNADRMVKKLKDEGLSPQKIHNDAKNVYYVSYSSFSDKASAEQELKKIKAAGSEGWIYSY